MKRAKVIQLLKETKEAERIENEENGTDLKKIIYFKYDKDNTIFIGNESALFCLDRNLIGFKRKTCLFLPDSIKNHIVEEVEGSDLVQIIKKAEIKENHDDYKKLCVFELENDPDGSLGFHFYLNKVYCDVFSDKAVYKTVFSKNFHYRSFIYVFENDKFVGLILQVKR